MSAVIALLCGGSASAQTLFAATGSNGVAGTLYTINPATGAVASNIGPIRIGATSIAITGLAFHPTNGTLYGVTVNGNNNARSVITINPSTGAATLIGASGGLGPNPVSDISFDNTGVLYGWRGGGDSGTTSLGTIDLNTGVFTPIGPTISSDGGGGLAFSTVSPFTLFLSINRSNGVLRTVNKATGVTTAGPTLSGAPRSGTMNALASNNAGVIFASNSDTAGTAFVNLVTINTTTGAVTNIGGLPNDTDAIAFQVSSTPPTVPVPPTLLLVITGLACVALYQLRGKLLPRRS